MKILIINEGATHNLGDRMILFCLQQLLKQKYSNATLYFQSYSGRPHNPNRQNVSHNVTQKVNFTNTLKNKLPLKIIRRCLWVFRNIKDIINHKKQNYDLVVIGGGELLDNYWLFPFVCAVWVFCFKSILGKKTILLGVGYGTGMGYWDKKLLKMALSKVDDIYIRDGSSIKRIYEEYRITCKFIPDVVFSVNKFVAAAPRITNKVTIFPVAYHVYQNSSKKPIPLIEHESAYTDFWVNSVRDWQNKGYDVYLSATDVVQDTAIVAAIGVALAKIDIKTTTQIPKDTTELAQIISSSSVVFSGRMHALIIGYTYKCTCVVYPVSHKLQTFSEEILNSQNDIDSLSDAVFSQFQNCL
jgi:polysaccharide pyruvyl transferase WcaK-like protein